MPNSSPDFDFAALIDAALAGSTEAANLLFNTVRPCLRAVAGPMLADALRAKVDPSDLVQEAVADALAGLPQFNGSTCEEFVVWLRAIQRNRAGKLRDAFAADKRDLRRERSIETLTDVASSDTPSQHAIFNEQVELRQIAWLQLSADDREVLDLHTFQGLPYEEVARRMGRSVAAVRRLHSHAVIRWHKQTERLDAAQPE
jgi:RNA polymerase sigma-70 factor (ECF subfamily)